MEDKTFLQKLNLLMQMHSNGLLGGEIMPEDALIGVVPAHDLPDVLTLGMALNYQRHSYKLWESVAVTYRDDDSRWIFTPNVAADSDVNELRDTLLRFGVGLQPNRHPVIWHRVARGLTASSPDGNVLGLIESADFDIAALKEMMQLTRKKEFPYLSGPKIFNYWLYVMEVYAGVSWKSRELITIAPWYVNTKLDKFLKVHQLVFIRC